MNTIVRSSVTVCRFNFNPFAIFATLLLAASSFVTGASAASVTYTLDLSVDNQWKVFASSNPEPDNFGIALYSIRFAGQTITADNVGPRTTAPSSGSGNPAGFTFLRSADNTSPAAESNFLVSASQDTTLVPNDHLIYGFSQENSSFALEGITAGGVIEQPTWFKPLLLAQGTYDLALSPNLTLDMVSLHTFVNVFSSADNPNDEMNPTVKKVENLQLIRIPFTANTPPTVTDAVISNYNANYPGDPQTLTHQFQATDTQTPAGPFTWDMLSLVSYTKPYSGHPGTGPFIEPTLSSSGEFQWISEGSPRGDYVWQVRATDPGGLSDFGTIMVNVPVPEPSTAALCAMAVLCMNARIRRASPRSHRAMNTIVRKSVTAGGLNLKPFAIFAALLLAASSLVTSASAANVTYTLDLSVDNQWKVFASSNPEPDNFGIALYAWRWDGQTITHDNASPRSTSPFSGSGNPAGFSFLRSADDTDPATENNVIVSASQDTTLVPNDHLIYGFSQEASSFVMEGITPGGVIEQPVWGTPLLLGQGTYNRALSPDLTIDTSSLSTFVNVFYEADDPNDELNPRVKKVENLQLIRIPYSENTPPSVVDTVVPIYNASEPGEPQTLILQLTADDAETPLGPFTWDMLSLLSHTTLNGNPGAGPTVAPTLSSSGEFEWISEGSPSGDYVWQVRASDPGGLSDFGTVFVRVGIPEPSTIVLCALAMLCICGRIGRAL